ncbi:MAG: tetratricopeptide repeat protein [Saccharothrix sp.]|nr:tetratricopeptide repeat protein [Saccharothrix sp.]
MTRQHAEAHGGSHVYQAGGDLTVVHAPTGGVPDRVWNVPPRNPNFTGRGEVLARIRSALGDGVVAVHSLHGLGGVGKSQTAIEYAHRHAAEYRVAWWVPAEQPDLVPGHLVRLAAALGVPEDRHTLPRLWSLLAGRSDWLLVFDNADHAGALHPHLPPGGHVLITTRNTGFGALGGVVDLDTLPRADSVAFLRKRVEITEPDADALADLMGDLPLGLAQAAAYLEETATPVADYLDLLRSRGALPPDGEVVGYPHTVATAWDLSVVRAQEAEPAVSAVLRLTAMLAPDAIPIDLMTTWLKGFTPALTTLVRHGLVRRAGDTYSIHRLLHARLRHETRPEDLVAVVSFLRTELPAEDRLGDPEARERARRLLPHVLSVADLAPADPGLDNALAFLLLACGRALRAAGQDRAASGVQERAYELVRRLPDPPPFAVEKVAVDLMTTYRDLGEHAKAMELVRVAMATRDPVEGDYLLEHYAGLLEDRGELGLARRISEDALAVAEARYPPDSPELARPLGNLASVLVRAGRGAEAVTLARRALDLVEPAHAADHPDVAVALTNLAAALVGAGSPRAALPVAERAKAMAERVFEVGHPKVALFWNNLAVVQRALGKRRQSRAAARRAHDILLAAYGPDHPQVREIRAFLG